MKVYSILGTYIYFYLCTNFPTFRALCSMLKNSSRIPLEKTIFKNQKKIKQPADISYERTLRRRIFFMGHLLKFKALGNLGVGPEHTFPFGIFLFEFLALFANSLLDNLFKQIGSKGEIVILKYNFEKF